MLIAEKAQSCGPKETVRLVSEKVGGVVNASSASQLPRNERQVSSIRSRNVPCSDVPSGSDEMLLMMQQAKIRDKSGLFVREIRSSPEPAFVLARERQLDDIERFCTNPVASPFLP